MGWLLLISHMYPALWNSMSLITTNQIFEWGRETWSVPAGWGKGQGAGFSNARWCGWGKNEYFCLLVREWREQNLVIQRTRGDSEEPMVAQGGAVPVLYFSLIPSVCFLQEWRHGWGRIWGKLFGVEQGFWLWTKYLHLQNWGLKKLGEPLPSPKWWMAPLHPLMFSLVTTVSKLLWAFSWWK